VANIYLEDNRPFIAVGDSGQFIVPILYWRLLTVWIAFYVYVPSKYGKLNAHITNSISTNRVYGYVGHNIKVNMFRLAYV